MRFTALLLGIDRVIIRTGCWWHLLCVLWTVISRAHTSWRGTTRLKIISLVLRCLTIWVRINRLTDNTHGLFFAPSGRILTNPLLSSYYFALCIEEFPLGPDHWFSYVGWIKHWLAKADSGLLLVPLQLLFVVHHHSWIAWLRDCACVIYFIKFCSDMFEYLYRV